MLMLYFSGTGNSEYIAKKFALHMGGSCHSIEEAVDFDALMLRSDTIAVCYPIYGSCVPRIMREFATKHKAGFENKQLIIFCTQMMFSGDGARAFARLLPGCDNRILYAEHFNMPNNISNFFLFPVREEERIKKQKRADKKLHLVCRNIQNGVVKKRGWSPYAAVLGKFQNIAFPVLEEKRKSSFAADEDCIQCGLCVKHCPMGNIILSQGVISQNDNCTLCYRCVNICPKKAATVMLAAKPKRQYKGMDALERLHVSE